jgi:putative addiction module killer protein
MYIVEKTDVFLKWLRGLNDVRAIARIQIRIDRISLGNMGDVKAVGEGISEMRIDYGPGYRVYFKKTGKTILLLLCGGDKTSQVADIKLAIRMAKDV